MAFLQQRGNHSEKRFPKPFKEWSAPEPVRIEHHAVCQVIIEDFFHSGDNFFVVDESICLKIVFKASEVDIC